MSKILVDDILEILREKEFPNKAINEIAAEIEKRLKEEKAEKEEGKAPKAKFEYVVVVNEDQMEEKVKDTSFFLVKMVADANFEKIEPTLNVAAVSFNLTKKGKKHPAKTLPDIFQTIKPKSFVDDVTREDIFRKKELKICQKEPLLIAPVKFQIVKE